MLTVRTSNPGWTTGENPFRHIPGVEVAHDPTIPDHRYEVVDATGQVVHQGPIDEKVCSRLRKLNAAAPQREYARSDNREPQVIRQATLF